MIGVRNRTGNQFIDKINWNSTQCTTHGAVTAVLFHQHIFRRVLDDIFCEDNRTNRNLIRLFGAYFDT